MNSRRNYFIGLVLFIAFFFVITNYGAKPVAATFGDVTVTKINNSTNQPISAWSFTLYKKSGSSWVPFAPSNQTSTKTTDSTGKITWTSVPWDTTNAYKVCETNQSGWTVQSPTGSDGCQPQFMITSSYEHEILTFKNNPPSTPPTRKIKIIKKDNAYPANYLSGWKFKATLTTSPYTVYPQPSGYSVATDSNGVTYIDGLPFGQYNVCEIQQSGWIASDPPSGCQLVTIDSSTPTGAAQTAGSVTTDCGCTTDIKTITFINKKDTTGALSVTKTVDWKGITPDTSKTFSICITGPSYPTTPNCKTVDYDGGTVQWDYLIPGSYTITEADPGSDWIKTVPSSAVTVSTGNCTYANVKNERKVGNLKVTKTVDWHGATPSNKTFEFCIKGPSYPTTANCKSLTLNAGTLTGYVQWNNLKPGSYTVTETSPGSDWTTTITTSPTTVSTGQTAYVSVKNDKTTAKGSLNVTKTVDWKGITPDTTKTFNICITGPSYPTTPNCKTVGYNGGSVQWDNLIPGDYTVTEQDPGSDWIKTVPSSAVTVSAGNCAYTNVKNERKVGNLKVTKTVDWHGATASNKTFEFCILGPSYPTTPNCKSLTLNAGTLTGFVQWNDIIPGSYTVTETNPGSDWTTTITTSPTTVVYGQTAYVSVKNDKTPKGSLNVTKTVDWKGITPDTTKTFNICITGPSYPTTPNCKTVGYNGGTVQWDDLLIGDYTVTEQDPGSDWIETVPSSAVTVSAGNCTYANVKNERKVGNLKITKTVDWKGTTPSNKTFEFCIKGPSYPTTPNCKSLTLNAGTLTGFVQWNNIIPGSYTVTETNPGTTWKVTVTSSPTNVTAGQTAYVAVKNDYLKPGIKIKKYTNGKDADSPNGGDVPQISVGGNIVWTYVVTNTGLVSYTEASVVVSDSVLGVINHTHITSKGNGDAYLAPGESWTFSLTGNALDLKTKSGTYIVNGCQTGINTFRKTYENTGIVYITDYKVSDNDPSHYCNPPNPGIVIKKFTNGKDADSANGSDVPQIAPNGGITWTYIITNTGDVAFPESSVVVTDNVLGITLALSDRTKTGDGDAYLEPGESWTYAKTGNALDLKTKSGTYIVNGCQTGIDSYRKTYENIGYVYITDYKKSAHDPSHYCNPPNPGIVIKKYTNGKDADSANGSDVPQVLPNGSIVWTYVITNTGDVAFPESSVVVTDNVLGITLALSDRTSTGDGNAYLEPGESWTYAKTGNALNLKTTNGTYVVNGCQTGVDTFRKTYENTGYVSITGYKVSDNDPSHYCNPPNPGIVIKKFTNGKDADSANGSDVPQVLPNGSITWTYIITNTGDVAFPESSVVVTDNVLGITLALSDRTKTGDGDAYLEPGESWTYAKTGTALDLKTTSGTYIVNGCQTGVDTFRKTYENTGYVSITGYTVHDDDPSHYCNPPNPGIVIKKYTNGKDADSANGSDVPQVLPNGSIVWTYVITNTGDVAFPESSVVVTDNVLGITLALSDRTSTGDGNAYLEPGESWTYAKTGNALNLKTTNGTYIVNGCQTGVDTFRKTYENTGYVSITGYKVSDNDPSHYCNPPNPGIVIKKYTNGFDADEPTGPLVPVGGEVTWTYNVTNSGDVPLSNIVVTDSKGVQVDMVDDDHNSFNDGDTNQNHLLDLTETWHFIGHGTATLGQYENMGYVRGTPPDGPPEVTSHDPSHYIGVDTALGDYVWLDSNKNGLQDDGPTSGVGGVTVNLLQGDCSTEMSPPVSTVTNKDGFYLFDHLTIGHNYCVQFELPNGYSFTTPNQGGDDAKDSDADTTTGKTTAVTLGNTPNLTLDAGLVKNSPALAALGDRVWYDTDSDGVQDSGELGTPNIPVKLLDATCTTEMDHTTTNDHGIYGFTNLQPGTYCVQFDISSVSSLYNFSPKDAGGDDAKDSDADTTTGKTTSVTLAAGDINNTLDAGLILKSLTLNAEAVCIKDAPYLKYTVTPVNFTPGSNTPVTIRFRDINDNSILQEYTNQPLSNEGLLWPGAAVDATGEGIQWPGWKLENGQWVQFPTGLRPEVKVEFSVNPTNSVTVTYPPSSPTCSTDPRASLGDRVWVDADHNGIQDSGETNVTGVKVTLFDGNNHQVGQPQTTDGNGNYLFTQLYTGTYYVVFDKSTLPPGFVFTTPKANGSTEATDSDADETTGQTAPVTLGAGQIDLDLDAGIYKPGNPALSALGDTVWFDINKNGLQDKNEPGVPGVKVVLHNADSSIVATETTNSAGKYLFTDLQPGPYFVDFLTVPGFSYTQHDVAGNTDDSTDSDAKVPWLDISIDDGGKEAELGEPFTFTVHYTNTEGIDAADIVISKTVPTGTKVQNTENPGWTCNGTDPGSICTFIVHGLAAHAFGSKTFTVDLSANAMDVPDLLDLLVGVTNETDGASAVVTLAPGETNLTVDAGIVLLQTSLFVATPTEPTNLPDGGQPGSPKIFLPALDNSPIAAKSDVADPADTPKASKPVQTQVSLYLPVLQVNK